MCFIPLIGDEENDEEPLDEDEEMDEKGDNYVSVEGPVGLMDSQKLFCMRGKVFGPTNGHHPLVTRLT